MSSSDPEWNKSIAEVFGDFQVLLTEAYNRGWDAAKAEESASLNDELEVDETGSAISGRGSGNRYEFWKLHTMIFRTRQGNAYAEVLAGVDEWLPAFTRTSEILTRGAKIPDPGEYFTYIRVDGMPLCDPAIWRLHPDGVTLDFWTNDGLGWSPETEFTVPDLNKAGSARLVCNPEDGWDL